MDLINMDLYKQLYLACELGNLYEVQILVNQGVDVNKRPYMYYPIEIASTYGHLHIVKYLYSIGCNPNVNNNFVIICASSNGHIEIVKYLYSIGCNPNVNNNFVIICASSNGHIEIVKYLYSKGWNPTVNKNAIPSASYSGHLEIVQYLVSVGCDPTINDNFAIKWVNMYTHLEVVKFLVSVGCDYTVIENKRIKKEIELWLHWKQQFNKCLAEIYGHPNLERTKTENEIYFKNYVN